MKLTSVGWKNLEDIVKIKALVKNYPNDMELGAKVRALIIKSRKNKKPDCTKSNCYVW